jgi:hypothetical protein
VASQKQKAIEMCRFVARLHGVPVRFYRGVSSIGAGGRAWNGHIEVWTGKEPPEGVVRNFFHELAHVLCTRTGKYPAFHGLHGETKCAWAVVYHGLQAERYVDALGRDLARMWLPTFKWRRTYVKKSEVHWFKMNSALEAARYLINTGEHRARQRRRARAKGKQGSQAAKVAA